MAGKPKNKEPLYVLPNGVEVWNELAPYKDNPYWRVAIRQHYLFCDEPKQTLIMIRRSRVIMAAHLGRRLKRSEIVHHKNENKEDDRFDNFEILSPSEHTRLHCKGKPMTEEHKRKISAGNKLAYAEGRKTVHGSYLKGFRTGYKPADETRKRMSIAAKARIAAGERRRSNGTFA